ncbi:Glutaredoxin family protein [Trifolium repens]|nr:Glutaredoxin family protein [Trifolium repens]
MKGVKGKLLKKLKTIKQINYLKPDRILQVKSSDGYADFLPKITSFNISNPFVSRENESKKIVQSCENLQEEEPEIIDVSELMRDLEEDEKMVMDDDGDDDYSENKENISHKGVVLVSQSCVNEETESKQSEVLREKKPPLVPRANNSDRKRKKSISENDNLLFRRPDLNSGSLFDPDLLAAFEEAVKEHSRMMEEQRKNRVEEQIEKIDFFDENEEDEVDPLLFFEEKCPPGGDGTVIFYTTSLRGIRKTFEDCTKIRFLLQSFKVLYLERDISMHREYKDELWSILGEKIVPPRLFIKGRYIGAAEEVLSLHEQGKLKKILEGVPMDYSNGPCDSCGGLRFVMCFKCNGSHKILVEKEEIIECLLCNENGLIVCPYCG